MAKAISATKLIEPKIEMVPLLKLLPYAGNARSHDAVNIAQIAASVREFGWTNPLLIDEEGRIIAGHGRLLAAQSLGMASVGCIRVLGLTETQKRALTIADNRIAETSGWNLDALKIEVDALTAEGFNLSIIGWDDAALAALFADPIEALGRTVTFPAFDEDIAVEHACPSCGYRWSGNASVIPPAAK